MTRRLFHPLHCCGAVLFLCYAIPLAAWGQVHDTATNAKPNTLSDEEQRLGFQLLFDGRSDAGWQHAGNWVVEDGAFYRKERGGDVTYTVAKVPTTSNCASSGRCRRAATAASITGPGNTNTRSWTTPTARTARIPARAPPRCSSAWRPRKTRPGRTASGTKDASSAKARSSSTG
jgi:hypothetical protein